MQDAEAILNFGLNNMRDKINPKDIYILGRSLGGAVAVYIINHLKPNIRGLIIENTFTSMPDLIDKIFPFLKHLKFLLLKNFWPTIDRIKFIDIPMLFFMSAKDELIPLEQMEQLYLKAQNAKFKSKYLIADGTHNESWVKAGRKYFSIFGKFIKRCGSDMNKCILEFDEENEEDNFENEIDNEKTPLNNIPNYHSINENEFVEIEEIPQIQNQQGMNKCSVFTENNDQNIDGKKEK